MSSTSDVLMNIHHRLGLLCFCDSGAGYKTAGLLTYLITVFPLQTIVTAHMPSVGGQGCYSVSKNLKYFLLVLFNVNLT